MKLSFHRNLAYDTVKKRCMEAMWGQQDDKSSSCFIADGSGVSIEKEEIELIFEDRTTGKTILWTLGNYLQVSHKYPSKTCIYCVIIPNGMHYNLVLVSTLCHCVGDDVMDVKSRINPAFPKVCFNVTLCMVCIPYALQPANKDEPISNTVPINK